MQLLHGSLFSIQVLFKNCRDIGSNVSVCLLEYKKIFDKARFEQMLEALKGTRID